MGIDAKVPVFGSWEQEPDTSQRMTTFSEAFSLLKEKREEEKVHPSRGFSMLAASSSWQAAPSHQSTPSEQGRSCTPSSSSSTASPMSVSGAGHEGSRGWNTIPETYSAPPMYASSTKPRTPDLPSSGPLPSFARPRGSHSTANSHLPPTHTLTPEATPAVQRLAGRKAPVMAPKFGAWQGGTFTEKFEVIKGKRENTPRQEDGLAKGEIERSGGHDDAAGEAMPAAPRASAQSPVPTYFDSMKGRLSSAVKKLYTKLSKRRRRETKS